MAVRWHTLSSPRLRVPPVGGPVGATVHPRRAAEGREPRCPARAVRLLRLHVRALPERDAEDSRRVFARKSARQRRNSGQQMNDIVRRVHMKHQHLAAVDEERIERPFRQQGFKTMAAALQADEVRPFGLADLDLLEARRRTGIDAVGGVPALFRLFEGRIDVGLVVSERTQCGGDLLGRLAVQVPYAAFAHVLLVHGFGDREKRPGVVVQLVFEPHERHVDGSGVAGKDQPCACHGGGRCAPRVPASDGLSFCLTACGKSHAC